MKLLKNWKTTLFGAMAAVGQCLAVSPKPLVAAIGQALAAIGVAGLGAAANDKGSNLNAR